MLSKRGCQALPLGLFLAGLVVVGCSDDVGGVTLQPDTGDLSDDGPITVRPDDGVDPTETSPVDAAAEAGADTNAADTAPIDAAGDVKADAASGDAASGDIGKGDTAAGDTATGDTKEASADGGPTTHVVKVGQGGTAFAPATVNIKPGDTVRWEWSSSGHSVVSGVACVADGKFCNDADKTCASAPTKGAGSTYQHVFPTAGTFPYFCIPHCAAGMVGSVVVL